MEKENSANPEKIELNMRPAEDQDYEFARQVHHAAYHDVVERQFGKWDEQAQDGFFQSAWKGSAHEIIYLNGEPAGYFSMDETDDLIDLHELVLLPKFQGQGTGTKILNEAIEKAKTKNKVARLQVLKANKAAELYRKLGFSEVGETDTHIKMEFDPNSKVNNE
jgi:ribosomal protein S18 acetylase RimI-like enzyme